jgi:calcineurin-like phosphoesterase family protein
MFSRKFWCSPPAARTTRHPSLPVALSVVCLISALAAWPSSSRLAPDSSPPLIAIADVHNAFDDFVSILRRTGLIDAQNHWSGGKSTFVQTGDLLDRGPKPREVLDLVMALEHEAPQAGGRVVSLLGNHELMNIMGDLRYVAPGNYASFADPNSPDRQKAAYNDFVDWCGKHSALLTELAHPMELTETEWIARHPLGFVEHREIFGPKGKYGEWLREHAGVAEIDGVLFLHAGIAPPVAGTKVDAMNKRIHEEIKNFDALKQYLQSEKLILPFFTLQEISAVLQAELALEAKSHASTNTERQARIQEFLKQGEWLGVRVDGPLWFRGYDQWSDSEGAPLIAKILDSYKASHVVVGHTVQKGGRIRSRFDNKIFLIDTGMLSSYYPGGRASALAICGPAKFVGVYTDQLTPFDAPAHPDASAAGASQSSVSSSSQAICSATQSASQ